MENNKIHLKYFMWEWQHTFHIHAKVKVESIFEKLDEKIKPNVFLVGILVEKRDGRHPICIQPENILYKPDVFSNVKKRKIKIADEDVYKNVLSKDKLEKRSYQKAITEALKKEDKKHDLVSFCCLPVLIEEYWVSVVLQLNKKIYNSYYSLKNNLLGGRYLIATSLLDAVINKYMELSNKALRDINPGEDMDVFNKDSEEVIRSAGKFLMYTPTSVGKEFSGLHHLFNSCNIISTIRYEGQEGIGEMIISRRNHPNVDIILMIDGDIPMHNYRAVRKILEMSTSDTKILSDSGYIYGLGKIKGTYDSKLEDLFTIKFTKYFSWELLHEDNKLMQVVYGQPSLPTTALNKSEFEKTIKRTFKEIGKDNINKIWKFVNVATKQKHGTIVVISKEAEKEAKRLDKQCLKIKPTYFDLQLINKVTAIDGAVLVEPDTKCHAIGVILDGLASDNGTPSRGARYNSAIRYVKSRKNPCIAVVVSQDGMIDIIEK